MGLAATDGDRAAIAVLTAMADGPPINDPNLPAQILDDLNYDELTRAAITLAAIATNLLLAGSRAPYDDIQAIALMIETQTNDEDE